MLHNINCELHRPSIKSSLKTDVKNVISVFDIWISKNFFSFVNVNLLILARVTVFGIMKIKK
jgi:hypothetical protein